MRSFYFLIVPANRCRERRLARLRNVALLDSLMKKKRVKEEQRAQQVSEKEKAVAAWEKEFVAMREEQRGMVPEWRPSSHAHSHKHAHKHTRCPS